MTEMYQIVKALNHKKSLSYPLRLFVNNNNNELSKNVFQISVLCKGLEFKMLKIVYIGHSVAMNF